MDKSKRFEDTLSVEDLMKKPQKELLANLYIQTLKINGTVRRNCKEIEDLENKVDEKIGWKIFAVISGVLMVIIVLFNMLDRIAGV